MFEKIEELINRAMLPRVVQTKWVLTEMGPIRNKPNFKPK